MTLVAAVGLLNTVQERHGALMFHQSDGSGRGIGFGPEAPEGMRFLSGGRAFTETEIVALQAQTPVTGTQAGVAFELGGRIPNTGSSVVADVVEACPVR